MATYAPPSETLPIFNPDVFLTNDAGDFLAFPVAQGSETFPFGLTATSLTTVDPTTIDSLVMSDLNPQYKIDYPVNSGRIDFYSNTAGGVSTRGGKIDATGVHTISKFDTIDETAGTLNIGTATLRTGAINIGTGADSVASKIISIGNSTESNGTLNLKTRTINIGGSNNVSTGITSTTTTIDGTTVNIKTASSGAGALNLGTGMTTGTIEIGTAASSTTAISIGTGSGEKSIILGLAGTTTSSLTRLRGYQIDLNPALGGILNLGTFMTSGTINIGTANSSSTAIEIGTGTTIAKSISIGNIDTGTTLIRSQTLSLNAKIDTGTLNLGQGMTGSSATINIGTESTSQTPVNIGTGTGTKTITIGNATGTTVALAGSTITASKMAVAGTLSAAATTLTSCACNTYTGTTMTITPVTSLAIGGTTAANSPFFNNVGGTTSINGGTATQGIDIGHGQSSGVINIGNITSRTGAINLGFSGQTTSLTANAVTINLGDTSTTGGIIVGIPLRPNYSPSACTADTMLGYKADLSVGALAATMPVSPTAGNINTTAFSINNGVWLVNVILVINYATQPSAPSYARLSLSTTSATVQAARTIDFNPNASGNNYCNYTTTVSNAGATNYYVVGISAGTVTPTISSLTVNVTRIA